LLPEDVVLLLAVAKWLFKLGSSAAAKLDKVALLVKGPQRRRWRPLWSLQAVSR